MYEIARKVLEMKTEAREKGKVGFEVVIGKTSNDPLDSLEGISKAYKEIWGEYPANYGSHQTPKTPPPPPPEQPAPTATIPTPPTPKPNRLNDLLKKNWKYIIIIVLIITIIALL
jgi:hypothetical protein